FWGRKRSTRWAFPPMGALGLPVTWRCSQGLQLNLTREQRGTLGHFRQCLQSPQNQVAAEKVRLVYSEPWLRRDGLRTAPNHSELTSFDLTDHCAAVDVVVVQNFEGFVAQFKAAPTEMGKEPFSLQALGPFRGHFK